MTHHEQGCEFCFDFARVYWNSRLEHEHRRLVQKLHPGQLVCDVMAGVGPFAVPAGKKKIFVLANDLNPHGWEAMEDAIERNKVTKFVNAFNMDGRNFIRWCAETLLNEKPLVVKYEPKQWRNMSRALDSGRHAMVKPPPEVWTRPQIPDHYIMNLPASAIDFLDGFRGLYTGKEELFAPHTSQHLPMIHVYCFCGRSEDPMDDYNDICNRIEERIGYRLKPGEDGTNAESELEIYCVRVVSPNKQMFCISFRLPKEVAFADRPAGS